MTSLLTTAALALTLVAAPMSFAATGGITVTGSPTSTGAVAAVGLPVTRPMPPRPATTRPTRRSTPTAPRVARDPSRVRGRSGGRNATDARWRWPLRPRPAVLRRFDPPAQRWGAGHRGVDLACDPGAVVLAPTDGVVAYVGRIAGRAVLSIEHAGGLRSTFEPVRTNLKVGATVRTGDPVGQVDATTHCAVRPCVHWGVKSGTDYLDPLALVTAPHPVLLPLW